MIMRKLLRNQRQYYCRVDKIDWVVLRNVHKDSCIRQPSNLRKTANDSGNHADSKHNAHHSREADRALGNLRYICCLAQNQDGNREELLERLSDVDEMTRFLAKESEEWITITHHWVARGIEFEVDFPDGPAREGGEYTEDDIESDTSAVADTGEDETGRLSELNL
jgi:hypothetical protein